MKAKPAHILPLVSVILLSFLPVEKNEEFRKDPPVQSIRYYVEKIRPDFKIGTYLREAPQNNDPYAAFVKDNFNAVTIGVYMKRTQETGKDSWNFSVVDKCIQFAVENNMKIKFHPGIGPDIYSPDWLVKGEHSSGELSEIMEERFRVLMERYTGDLKAFELVNEAVDWDASGQTWQTGDNVWIDIGWTQGGDKYPLYLAKAFDSGRKYGKGVELILNDNNNSMPESTRAQNFYKALKILLDNGLPIDGIGLQLHCSVAGGRLVEGAFGIGSPIDTASIKKMIRKYGALGVDVHITEFDVHLAEKPTEQDYEIQANAYQDILKAALESPYCKSFTTWGFADPDGWAPKGYNPHSLWLDDSYRPKENYLRVLKMLQKMAGEN
jgi:endo-1,4-beta-xylanase